MPWIIASKGPLSDPTTAVPPSPLERLFVPHTCRSQRPSGAGSVGWKTAVQARQSAVICHSADWVSDGAVRARPPHPRQRRVRRPMGSALSGFVANPAVFRSFVGANVPLFNVGGGKLVLLE